MDPDRWRRIEEIYQAAAERKPEERDAFLADACGGDEELRSEVASLLKQQSVDTPLDHPACEVAGGLPSPLTLERASDLAGHHVSHYEIQQKLGEGGMGVVYKARDVRLGRTVALKVLPLGKLADPDRKRRFVQEARAASALNHPNIVHVYDIASEGGTDYIVMEFVAGKTLDQMIPSKGMRLNEALKMASQMAGGLSAAHTAGIVHRDVKPGNVMVTASGVVKLLDFGLAKLTEPETAGEMRTTQLGLRTEEGMIVGTASYMSPEQAQGEKVDTRSDIFSFGTVLYEMLTGRRLFARDTQAQSLAAILDSEPPPLPAEIPRELERVVARCLRKDVDHRFQHMDDVKIALDELKEDADSGRLNAPSGVPRSPKRKRWIWVAGAVAAVLLVAGGWYMGRSRSETASRPSMRFTITLPAEAPLAPAGRMPLGQDRPTLSLSPDGNRLAYVAQVGNNTQIYTRDMQSGKVEPLPETLGGHSPFFSPDGASIAFFADSKLKKISSTGGPVLSLADAPQPFGGVWGSDGFIYFNRMGNEGLHKISADGGAVEGVIKGVVSMPELLSPAHGLLASSADAIVHVNRTVEPRRLIAGFGARYARSGHLVYAMQGRLMAVSFNRSRVEVTGTPASLFGDLRTGSLGVAQFTIAHNGTLVYAPGHPESSASFVWVDRTGQARPAGLPERQYLPCDLSPDGRRLAFGLNTGEFEEAEIWVHDWQQGTTSRLTPRSEDGRKAMYLYPRWTPDGRNVVHFVRQDGKRRLLWQPSDGSAEAVELWPGKRPFPVGQEFLYLYPASFAPDGSTMMLFGLSADRSIELFTMRLEQGFRPPAEVPELYLGTPFAESFGQISPDGHWMVYTSDQTGRWEIYVTSYPKPGATHLVSRGNAGHKPMWNPAASEIVYRLGTKLFAVDVTLSPDFRAGVPRLLFEGPYASIPGFDWDISPDGKEFLLLENKDVLKPVTTLTVVTNFFDELRRRVPPGSAKE